jgi:hypothetical protein
MSSLELPMNRIELSIGTVVLVVVASIAPAAHSAVAVLERMAGQPAIYEVGEAGARQVSLPRQGARYTLPIEIETGSTDSATFRLPDGDISVAANTIMRVAAPQPRRDGWLQRVLQKSGSALFSVDRRDVEHFEVETPFLVSVVKGTLFTVVVHDEGATVSLHEGRLQVNSPDGAGSVELNPGDVAFSNRDGELHKLENTMASREPAGAGASLNNPRADARSGHATQIESVAGTGDGIAATLRDNGSLSGEIAELPAGMEALALETADDALGDLAIGLDDVAGAGLVEVADTAGDLLDSVADAAIDLGGDPGSDFGDSAADVAGNADDFGDVAGGFGDTAGDVAADFGDDAGDLGSDLGDSAGLLDDLGDSAGDLVGDLGGSTGALIGDLGDVGGDLIGDLGGAAADLTGGLGDSVTDLVSGVADTGVGVVDDVGDLAGDLVGDAGDVAGDLVSDVGDTAGDLVGDVGDAAEDLTDGVTGGAGDILGNPGGLLGGLRL